MNITTWLLSSAILSALTAAAPSAQTPLSGSANLQHVESGRGKVFTPTDYSIVGGFFQQSAPDFDPDRLDLLSDSFGLLPSATDPERWIDFSRRIELLNECADELTTYKVLILARHGQGWHNVAESKYGTAAWDAYWSRVNGDGEIAWGPDPELTPLGRAQAVNVSLAWARELADGAPRPGSFYSSPLRRSAETLRITWREILKLGEEGSKRPLVKEMLRETIGLHTCDQRSSKSELEKVFPEFDFDVPFSEHDQLWGPDYQEVSVQQSLRAQQLLNQLFATDPHTVISLTAHGGTIMALCRALGHPITRINPGEFLPVVVRATAEPRARGRLFAGGQSKTAPPLTQPTARAAAQRA